MWYGHCPLPFWGMAGPVPLVSMAIFPPWGGPQPLLRGMHPLALEAVGRRVASESPGGNPSSASSSGRPWGSGCRHLPGFCFCSKAWTNPGLAQDYAVATGSPVLHVCFSDFRFADCFALYTAKAHTWPGSDKLGKKEGMEGGRQGRREWREPFAGFQSLSHA